MASGIASFPVQARGALAPIKAYPFVQTFPSRRAVCCQIGTGQGEKQRLPRKSSRNLYPELDGLATRAEEDAFAVREANGVQDLSRCLFYDSGRIAIGYMRDLRELRLKRSVESLVAVPQGRAPNAGLKIDVASAMRIVQVAILRSNQICLDQLIAGAS
jgi:hypothetical protein